MFKFCGLRYWFHDPLNEDLQTPSMALTYRVRNVELLLDMDWHNFACLPIEEDPDLAPDDSNKIIEILKDFSDAKVMRNTIRLVIPDYSWFTIRLVRTPCFEDLKKLVGFNSAVLQIQTTDKWNKYLVDTPSLAPYELFPYDIDLAKSACGGLVSALKEMLEPALGSAKIGELEGYDEDHGRRLEIWPR